MASKKKTAKKKSPRVAKAEKSKMDLAVLVKGAKRERASNSKILREVRKDPGLAEELKELLCSDLRRVSEIPRDILGPSSSRARYRELGHYSTSIVDFIFGVWAEFQRQAGLAPTLHTSTVRRNISRVARAQDLASYATENVTPWNGAYDKLNMGKKMVSLIIGSDFHSHYCNPFALRVWNDVIRRDKPDGIRLNGDLVDFPQLSTHRQFPGHFPMTVQDEMDWAVKKVIAQARKNAPRADIKFIIGNHDIRLMTALADKGPMFASVRDMSFAKQFELDKYKVGLVCRSNFLNLTARQRTADIAQNWETLCAPDGRMLWTTVHGFLCGKDAPRKHVARFMTHGTNGHLHDRQMVSAGSQSTGVVHWFQTPCMAHPQAVAAGYIQGPSDFTGWSCGFLRVDIYPETGYIDAKFIEVGEEMAAYNGKVYTITQEERDQIQEMLEI